MKTCINEYDLDLLAKAVVSPYSNNGVNSFDVFDKDNNRLILDYDLATIEECINEKYNSGTTFYAQGYVKIPYKMYSSTASTNSSSFVSLES